MVKYFIFLAAALLVCLQTIVEGKQQILRSKDSKGYFGCDEEECHAGKSCRDCKTIHDEQCSFTQRGCTWIQGSQYAEDPRGEGGGACFHTGHNDKFPKATMARKEDFTTDKYRSWDCDRVERNDNKATEDYKAIQKIKKKEMGEATPAFFCCSDNMKMARTLINNFSENPAGGLTRMENICKLKNSAGYGEDAYVGYGMIPKKKGSREKHYSAVKFFYTQGLPGFHCTPGCMVFGGEVAKAAAAGDKQAISKWLSDYCDCPC